MSARRVGVGVACALLGGLAAAPATAPASVLDIYGYGPRGTAMGNAQAAVADDHTAIFYNPAGLTRPKKVSVSAGFIATFPRLTIDRDFSADHQAETGNELPPDFAGFHLGALFPLGERLDNRVAIGVSIYLPTLNLLRGEGIDPQIPQFYRYQNLPDKFVFMGGIAVEPADWLSLGAGVQVLADLDGAVGVDIEIANRRVTTRSVEADIAPRVAPVAGLQVRPLPGLTLGGSFRGRLQLDFALPATLSIDDVVALDIDIRGTVLFTPDIWNFGAAYQLDPANLLISAELGYERWSQAPDPSPTFALDVSGELAEALGLGERLDVGRGGEVALNFRDVPVWRFGLEQTPHEQFRLRAGYTYRPSPAPIPTEAYNYLDNDAHLLAVGAGFIFGDPLEVHRNPVTVDVVYQATMMSEQHVRKSAGPADLVGDYRTGGTIHSVGIAVRHDL